MKLFKNIMSRKPDPEETVGKIDLDMDVEPLRRRSDILADDTGAPNGSAKSRDPLFADSSKPSYGRGEEPEEVAGAGWGANAWDTDDWDDDEDWGDDDLDDVETDTNQSLDRAMSQGRDWAEDEDFGRKAIARSQLGGGGGAEDRILEKTNSKMVDRESSRRHSAMAHLKAAAAATKADRVLKDTASRDPAADPEEQSPYRDDLAKVVRPRSVSRPSTRPTTRPTSVTPNWDAADFEDDADQVSPDEGGFEGAFGSDDFEDGASRFASDPTERFMSGENRFATEESAFEADEDTADEDAGDDDAADDLDNAADILAEGRPSLIPDDLSEDDFADDVPAYAPVGIDRFGIDKAPEDDLSADQDDEGDEDEAFELPDFPRAVAEPSEQDEAEAAFAEDDIDEDDEVDGPVASTAVSEAIALANAPDEPEEIDGEDVRRKIWDLAGDAPLVRDPIETRSEEPAPAPAPETPEEKIVDVTAVAPTVTGRAGRSAGRVKTRLLGFQEPDDTPADVFDAAKPVAPATQAKYPVGWIIVIEGPGHGSCFTLFNGVSQIGRGEEQAIRLDYGDTSISRNNHAAVAFDDEQSKFFLGHGGKSNLVRLNGRPVLSTEDLTNGDTIRIGETTLKFVALCGDDFKWNMTDGEDAQHGENA